MTRTIPGAVFFLLAITAFVFAQESSEATSVQDDTPKNAALVQALKDLNSESFDARQAARKILAAGGAAAVPLLQEVAADAKSESGYSAVLILAEIRSSEDEADQLAADKALKAIAKGKDASARQAARALESKIGPPEPLPQQFGGRQAGNVMVSSTNINGTKRTVVNDPQREIEIRETPDGKIRIETRDKDADESVVIKADSADDLRKNHKDAWRLYQEYSGQRGVRRFGFRQFGGGIGRPGNGGFGGGQIGGFGGGNPFQQLEQMQKEMQRNQARMFRDLQRQGFAIPGQPFGIVDTDEARVEISAARGLADDLEEQAEKMTRRPTRSQVKALQKTIRELHERLKKAEDALDQDI